MPLNFKTNEIDLICKVADRVQSLEALHRDREERRERMHIVMDLCVVQNSSTPLDLARLLEADDFNFAHDVFGIERHLDRRNDSPTAGELLDCFLPRFAMQCQRLSPNDPPHMHRTVMGKLNRIAA